MADTAPDKSLAMLESLVNLYGANAADRPTASNGSARRRRSSDDAARTADVVQLAERRIETMRADAAECEHDQLATLEERLAAAEQLAATNPQQAAAMYRAIVDLHESDAWAAAVVAKARNGSRTGEEMKHDETRTKPRSCLSERSS